MIPSIKWASGKYFMLDKILELFMSTFVHLYLLHKSWKTKSEKFFSRDLKMHMVY